MSKAFTWRVRPAAGCEGATSVPGDKSISHRAVLLGALADGVVVARGFLEAADTLASVRLARALGAEVVLDGEGRRVEVHGCGVEGLRPAGTVDCGNSGTTLRLGAGICAAIGGLTVLTGDDSLRRRPMKRVIDPLRAMGATVSGAAGDTLAPLEIRGGDLKAIDVTLSVASAQVKSAILLGGLRAQGTTLISEPGPSRDHTERLLRHFGADVESPAEGTVAIRGGQRLEARPIDVCGDISSAAFLLGAAAIVEGGAVTVTDVGLNPTRTGFFDVLAALGGDVETEVQEEWSGEPVGRVTVRQRPLVGTTLGGGLVVRSIDELPLVAVLATQAEGRTLVADAGELRAKESDRIAAVCSRLRALGADIDQTEDGFVVRGPTRLSGATLDAAADHRIAMAVAVAGLVAAGETVIEGAACAEVSYPGFADALGALTEGAIHSIG